MRLSNFADVLALDVSTVSRHVGALESLDLVAREPDPGDRRATLLRLTPQGSVVLERMLRARRDLFAEALADWSSEDLERLGALLTRFADALDAVR